MAGSAQSTPEASGGYLQFYPTENSVATFGIVTAEIIEIDEEIQERKPKDVRDLAEELTELQWAVHVVGGQVTGMASAELGNKEKELPPLPYLLIPARFGKVDDDLIKPIEQEPVAGSTRDVTLTAIRELGIMRARLCLAQHVLERVMPLTL